MFVGAQLTDVLRRAPHSARLDRLGQSLVAKGRDVVAMYDLNQVVQLITERLCGQFNLPSWACRALLDARRAPRMPIIS